MAAPRCSRPCWPSASCSRSTRRVAPPRRTRASGRAFRTSDKEHPIVRKQVLVSVDRGETRVALMEAAGSPKTRGRKQDDYRVAELYLERRGARSIVGNIYKGRVDNVLAGLEAAF